MGTRTRLVFAGSLGALAAIVVACSLTTSLSGYSNGPYDDAATAPTEAGAADALVDAPSAEGAAPGDASADGSKYAATVLADDPILYYRLGETTAAGPAKDSSKSGRAATFKGAVIIGRPHENKNCEPELHAAAQRRSRARRARFDAHLTAQNHCGVRRQYY